MNIIYKNHKNAKINAKYLFEDAAWRSKFDIYTMVGIYN